MSNNRQDRQVTDAGARTAIILLRDKITGEYIGRALIKRAKLAQYYNEHRVTHAVNSVPVVDV